MQDYTSYPLLKKVWEKLTANGIALQTGNSEQELHLHLFLSSAPEANASTSLDTDNIFITKRLLDVIGSDEGELAFVLAHEIGHQISHRAGLDVPAKICTNALDAVLFPADERNCLEQAEEIRADSLGFTIMRSVGYNPYDAAALFGRLQMLAGKADPSDRTWNQYSNDHPWNEDRIENLRRIMETPNKRGIP